MCVKDGKTCWRTGIVLICLFCLLSCSLPFFVRPSVFGESYYASTQALYSIPIYPFNGRTKSYPRGFQFHGTNMLPRTYGLVSLGNRMHLRCLSLIWEKMKKDGITFHFALIVIMCLVRFQGHYASKIRVTMLSIQKTSIYRIFDYQQVTFHWFLM